jgi:hypothetical protein
MKRLLVAIIIAATCGSAAANPVQLPLQGGEKLTYRVSWAIVPGAGEIKITAEQDASATNPQLVVRTKTATKRLARVLLPFDAEGKSVFDLRTGRMIGLEDKSVYKQKTAEHRVTFDYTTRRASYLTVGETEPPRVLEIPDGNPTDLIMGLLQTRNWDLKPGEKRDALVLFEDDFYELTIHMARYEQLRTGMGTFKTVVLEPRMEKTPPKGMFKRGSSVRVWIAQDDHRLPVKFEVEFKIGTGTATLEAYEGPAKVTASNAKDPRP